MLLPLATEVAALVAIFEFDAVDLALIASNLVFLVFVLVLGVLPGQKGANRFGEQPKPWLGWSTRGSTATL